MASSLFDVLTMDERIIVYSSEEDGIIITWNQSNTLIRWYDTNLKRDAKAKIESWEECGILFPTGRDLKSYKQARELALAWHTDSL